MAEIHQGELFMMDDAEIGIIAYGSVARSAKRAVRDARERGIKVGLLKLMTIWPFMRTAVEGVLSQCRAVVVPEMNMGQISREVKRVNQGKSLVKRLSKIDGTMITPDEILRTVMEVR
jgi:2-oxoglutarate ferredoxin oxidoreductase subunit alpha